MTQTSQGSITIRRLRRGYTLQMYFKNLTSVPLYQGVDSAGNVAPSWSNPTGNDSDSDTAKDAKRPQLQPVVESTTGQAVTLSQGKWTYISTELTFDSTGKCTNATDNGFDYSATFKLSTDGTYTLTIIGDLARKDTNEANDLLTFSCAASVKGATEQTMTGHVTIVISPLGTGSYDGHIGFTSQTIEEGSDSIDVTLSLLYGGTVCLNFKYAIKEAGTAPAAADMKTVTGSSLYTVKNAITKDMVSGQTTFFVYFYAEGETDPTAYVDCDGFSVLDRNDEYRVDYQYDSVAKMVIGDGDSDTVGLTARIINTRTGEAVTTTSAEYTHTIYRGAEENAITDPGSEDAGNWKAVRTATGTSITLSNKDSDYTVTGSDGTEAVVQSDITVVGSCTFEI